MISFILISFIASAQVEKIEFQAAGLTCSMCSNAINKALKNLPFVETVETDLNKNLFSITVRKNTPVDFDAITRKVEGAGFSVAKFWAIIDMPSTNITNNQHLTVDGLNFHFLGIQPQTINGKARLQVIDQHYVLAKAFKQFSHDDGMTCYKTGQLGNCCPKINLNPAGSARLYHVTI